HDWHVTSLDVIGRYGVFDVVRGDYVRADGYARAMHTLACPDWVNVLPVTGDAHVILVRQYRPGSACFTWEFPGGVMDPGEDALEAGRRELFEETGYEAEAIEAMGSAFANPALQGNRIHYVLAHGAREVSAPTFDGAGEECERILVPLAELEDLL